MRCPKCGFISFDHLERCKKCGKDIAEAAAELEGTVFDTSAPLYLKFEAGEGPEESDSMAAGAAVQEKVPDEEGALEEAGAEVEITLEDEVELVLGDEEDDLPGGDDVGDLLAGLAGEEAVAPPDRTEAEDDLEPALELGGEQPDGDDGIDGLQLDFGDIDISDLGPPAEDQEEVEELTLDSGEEAAPVMTSGPAPAAGKTAGGLEDLEIDGLDLDSPSPVAGSVASGRLPPAVKTGTALDDFDIDLGELLAGGKKEKSVDNAT